MGWFARMPAAGAFVADLLGPSLLVGLALADPFIALTVTAVEGVSAQQYGLASGLINTTQQIGGALGLAILAAVANSRTSGLLESRGEPVVALTEGFQAGLLVAAGFAVAAIVLVAAPAGGTPPRKAGRKPAASAPAPQPADA
jgi:sugar phosphate permease